MTTSDLVNEMKNRAMIRLSGNFSDFAPHLSNDASANKFKTPDSAIPSEYIA